MMCSAFMVGKDITVTARRDITLTALTLPAVFTRP
jgi:hypothetical protein